MYVTNWILHLSSLDVYRLVLTFRVCTDLLRVNLMFVYNTWTVRRSVMYYISYIIRRHDFTHDMFEV
jgi:hypothetical protein